MRFLRTLVLASVVTALHGAVGTDTFHWSGRVPVGQSLEIRGLNGSIHAEPAPGDQVDVVAYRNGRQIDPAEIQVRVVEHDGGVTICAVSSSASGSASECSAEAGAAQGDASVDFTVRVPKGIRFVARTVNGLVEANALEADTEAHTVNGNLRLNTAGAAQGETVNGSIVASVGRITGPLSFSTVNGAITVEMPAGAAAEVHANTVNGRILTEFPLALGALPTGKHADGPIGRGGPALKIATVNGSISLRRARRCS